MRKLRSRFERFCHINRNKGIPNLMLYVILANLIVYVGSFLEGNGTLFYALCFDRDLILQGQIWRLFTGFFTGMMGENPLLFGIVLYCEYSLGRGLEYSWGTFRFNLFYLSGAVIMGTFAMLFGGIPVVYGGLALSASPIYADMGLYLNLSLLIAYATTYPDSQFIIFFIIPVKAWIMALLYLAVSLYQVVQLSRPIMMFPHNLFPLVAILNYFLFAGSDVRNVIPGLRNRQKRAKTVRVHINSEPKQKAQPSYIHRCVICGKTDVSHPQLEFRYCSRCNGYFCYCQEHINNHTHVE